MAVTQGEIDTYIYNIRGAFADYGYTLSNYQRIGSENIDCLKIRFNLLNYYVKVIIDYLGSNDYENVNFFTTDEARDIIQKINNICCVYYMLAL